MLESLGPMQSSVIIADSSQRASNEGSMGNRTVKKSNCECSVWSKIWAVIMRAFVSLCFPESAKNISCCHREVTKLPPTYEGITLFQAKSPRTGEQLQEFHKDEAEIHRKVAKTVSLDSRNNLLNQAAIHEELASMTPEVLTALYLDDISIHQTKLEILFNLEIDFKEHQENEDSSIQFLAKERLSQINEFIEFPHYCSTEDIESLAKSLSVIEQSIHSSKEFAKLGIQISNQPSPPPSPVSDGSTEPDSPSFQSLNSSPASSSPLSSTSNSPRSLSPLSPSPLLETETNPSKIRKTKITYSAEIRTLLDKMKDEESTKKLAKLYTQTTGIMDEAINNIPIPTNTPFQLARTQIVVKYYSQVKDHLPSE